MQINVLAAAPANPPALGYIPAATDTLRTNLIKRLVNVATGAPGAGVTINQTRQLTLNEAMGAGGPLEVLLNNTRYNGTAKTSGNAIAGSTAVNVGGVTTYYSELPQEGQTELWEIVNLTADAHPIHLHLVQFQLMNRQAFDLNGYLGAYAAAFPTPLFDAEGPPNNYNTPNTDGAIGGNPAVSPFLAANPIQPPLAQEAGWKDTVIMSPGQVTRIMVRWAPMDLPINTPAANAYFPFTVEQYAPMLDHVFVILPVLLSFWQCFSIHSPAFTLFSWERPGKVCGRWKKTRFCWISWKKKSGSVLRWKWAAASGRSTRCNVFWGGGSITSSWERP